MNKLSFSRQSDDGIETIGNFFVTDSDSGATLLKGFTLELPYKDNQHRISCIPPGTYNYSKCLGSDHIPYEHLILEVQNRDGICVHAGNYHNDSLGCILVGKNEFKATDGSEAISNSRDTLTEILAIIPESGTINISENFSE
jgi:Family of unknown function (DUF5675)